MDERVVLETLDDVIGWAERMKEPKDTIGALRRIPRRLGSTALSPIPACLETIESKLARCVDTYAELSRSGDPEGARRREDSRIRAALGRFAMRDTDADPGREAVRQEWAVLRDRIARNGGERGTTGPFARSSHRTIAPFVARARLTPAMLDQPEVDRVVEDMGSNGRSSVAGGVATLNDCHRRQEELGLVGMVPTRELVVPPAGIRADRVYWATLPAAFRASAEAAIDRAASPDEVAEEELLARLDAGEDPEALMVEADAIANAASTGSRNAAEFTINAKGTLSWLIRAREAHCGLDRGTLTSLYDLLCDAVLRPAIDDHIAAAAAGRVKKVGHASTLTGRLTFVDTLAARGLGEPRLAARFRLLKKTKVTVQAKRDRAAHGEMMVADEIATRMRRAPAMGVAYVNAPDRLASIAEARIEAAKASGSETKLLAAYAMFRGATMAAILMSRPPRGHHLHEALIRQVGQLAGNLERLPGGVCRFTWRSTGSKNAKAFAITLRDGDAEILLRWLDVHRADYMKAAGIDDASPYLFPGTAAPKRSSYGVPMPTGTRSRESLRADWRAATACLGYPTTPHKVRHIVAILTLARHPGNFGRVGSILGITEGMAQERYGRDNGDKAAQHVRAALLAEHGDVLGRLGRRLTL